MEYFTTLYDIFSYQVYTILEDYEMVISKLEHPLNGLKRVKSRETKPCRYI